MSSDGNDSFPNTKTELQWLRGRSAKTGEAAVGMEGKP